MPLLYSDYAGSHPLKIPEVTEIFFDLNFLLKTVKTQSASVFRKKRNTLSYACNSLGHSFYLFKLRALMNNLLKVITFPCKKMLKMHE